MQPVVTDDTGRFRFQLGWLPFKIGPDADSTVTIGAFDPLRPVSNRIVLKFDRTTREADVRDRQIVLKAEPLDAALDTLDLFPEKTASLAGQPSLSRKPAPELDCQTWLNADGRQHRLADFRGKYVLLDFWATWCGPCHSDFPKIKFLRHLYESHGLVVIGFHDNSVPLESIREHVSKIKLDFLIAVDHPDGRTFRAYEKLGIHGCPSYVLIDPKGIVIQTDKPPGQPNLRTEMIQIVRNKVLAQNTRQAAGRQSPENAQRRKSKFSLPSPLFNRWDAREGLFEGTPSNDPITGMASHLESLTPPLRPVWAGCSCREFNIGYDCGLQPWAFNEGLSAERPGGLAAAGASLRWTLYPDRDQGTPNQSLQQTGGA